MRTADNVIRPVVPAWGKPIVVAAMVRWAQNPTPEQTDILLKITGDHFNLAHTPLIRFLDAMLRFVVALPPPSFTPRQHFQFHSVFVAECFMMAQRWQNEMSDFLEGLPGKCAELLENPPE